MLEKWQKVEERRVTVDQLTSTRIFLAVAEANVLNGAARQLGLSASAVSKHIAALENRLGAQLFIRTTRHIALTEVGASYLEKCQQIIADLDKADAEARSAGGYCSRPFAGRGPHLALLRDM